MVDFDVALCGQCSTCQRHFPCEELCALQVQYNDAYQDTGRLICFACQREMNPRAYQVRKLTREEVTAALRWWLAQRHFLSAESLPD